LELVFAAWWNRLTERFPGNARHHRHAHSAHATTVSSTIYHVKSSVAIDHTLLAVCPQSRHVHLGIQTSHLQIVHPVRNQLQLQIQPWRGYHMCICCMRLLQVYDHLPYPGSMASCIACLSGHTTSCHIMSYISCTRKAMLINAVHCKPRVY
jgi:hypothetical protein